jgi:hypothetical protein
MSATRPGTERQCRYLSDLADRIAARDRRPRHEVLTDLGLYESTPWGPRARTLTRPLASAAIGLALRDLEAST